MTQPSTATLAGHRATHARAYLPAWGVWYAEVALDEEVALSGAVELRIADLVLSGTIVSGGPSARGRSSYRVAAGAASWGRTIPAASYTNDAGVKPAAVILDAARACGETVAADTLPTAPLGIGWTRDAAPAARVLESIAPRGWYVDEAGTTRIGRRPRADLAVEASRGPVDRARGTVTIAAESIATVLPGVVVDGIEAVDVLHEVAPDAGLRSTIWGAGISETSAAIDALARLLDALDPDRRFRGLYEYRVVTQDGERLNLQPIRVSLGMPDIRRAKVRPGVAGARADVALGSRVLVGFVNADRARGEVVGFEDAEGDGFAPSRLDLVGDDDTWTALTEAGRVVRYGDMITFPVGAAATMTPMPVSLATAAVPPVIPPPVSRVRA